VTSRYEPVRWALPADALVPSASAAEDPRRWFNLYVELAPGGTCCWCTLAAAKASSGGGGTCWIVLEGVVYDVTEFKHRHPGMAASLELFGGTDASDAFREVPHSQLAHRYMRSLEATRPEDGSPLRLAAERLPTISRSELSEGRQQPQHADASRASAWLEMAQDMAPEWLKARFARGRLG